MTITDIVDRDKCVINLFIIKSNCRYTNNKQTFIFVYSKKNEKKIQEESKNKN